MADLNPEYCVSSIVLDLLQSDSADAQLIGLRTLYLVATSVPRSSTAAIGVQASIPRRSLGLSASSLSGSSSSGKRMMQVGLCACLCHFLICFRGTVVDDWHSCQAGVEWSEARRIAVICGMQQAMVYVQ